MKKYIALKAAKFDRRYQKGEEIPKNVIDTKMISKLERCGCIAVREVEEEQESSEQEQEESSEQGESPEQEETGQYNEKELLQYKKEELEHIAEQKGIEIQQGMTKADIIALLLQKE